MSNDQWISFKVKSEIYAHSVDKVKEIIPYTPPTPVPGSPQGIEGILNVRGNVVTILSGHSLFELEEPKAQEQRRIIILELGVDQVGVSVDAVNDIITFKPEDAQWIDQNSVHQLIKGTLHLGDQLCILIDFASYDSFSNQVK